MNAAGEESGELVEVRLLQLPVALWERAARYGGFTAEQEVELANAAAGGLQEIELTFQLPAAAAKAAADLGKGPVHNARLADTCGTRLGHLAAMTSRHGVPRVYRRAPLA